MSSCAFPYSYYIYWIYRLREKKILNKYSVQILVAKLTLIMSFWQETFWKPKSSWILLLPNYQETGLSRSLTSSLPDAKQGVFQFYIPMMSQDFQLFPYKSSFTVARCDQASSGFMHGWTAAWWNVELSWRKSSPSSTKAGFPAALKYSFMVETPTEFCLKSFQQLNLIQFYSELPVTAWQHAHIHKINYPFSVEYFKQYYS